MTPSTAKEFYAQGMEYFENGNWDLAIANFTSSINIDGGNADAYDRRGEAYIWKGDYNRAIENFNRAIAMDANRAMFWLHRGWAYHNFALYNPPYIREQDGSGQWNDVVDRNRVNYYHNQALSDINNALVLDPDYYLGRHNRGWLHLNVGNYYQAIDDCNRALALDSNSPGTWNNRGVAHRRLKKWAEATRDFDQAISLDPNYQLAINNRREAIGSRRTMIVTRVLVAAGVVVAAIVIAAYTV